MVTLVQQSIRMGLLPSRIEILGAFGSGKTTLASRLAADVGKALLESHEANIFWGKAAINEHLGYLPYDLSFLLQHINLASNVASPSSALSICDWSFASDRLWASMRLGSEMPDYERIHRILTDKVGPPIGYLYLRQPVALIADRILKRDRIPEVKILGQLAAAVAQLDECVGDLPPELVETVTDDLQTDQLQAFITRWIEAR